MTGAVLLDLLAGSGPPTFGELLGVVAFVGASMAALATGLSLVETVLTRRRDEDAPR